MRLQGRFLRGVRHGRRRLVTVRVLVFALGAGTTVASSGPTLAKMEPVSGAPGGAEVVLTGTGFAAAATENVVRFNGIVAEVKEHTGNSLTVEVPPTARTGRVELDTPDGTVTAPADFTVAQDASESLFDTTMRASISDPDPSQVAVVTADHKARVLFVADRGDAIGFGLQGATFSSRSDISLVSPQGITVASSNLFTPRSVRRRATVCPWGWRRKRLPRVCR